MKGKNRYLMRLALIMCVWAAGMLLTGCKEVKDNENTLPAYIIISEELDVQKTADKVNQILNTGNSEQGAEEHSR